MEYDLIIVGGGLVGAGLAASLAGSQLRIALIDAKLPSANDPRLFALNYSSCTFLQNLHLWDELKVHAAAIHEVHVSKRGSFGAVRLKREDISLPSLGYVIPAFQIETALNAALLRLPQVTLYRPATVTGLQQHSVTIQIGEREEIISAPLIIGADGVESAVRRLLNIEVTSTDYQQTAIVTRTRLQRPHQYIAYERFTESGAIAMLPLQDDECATIWTVDNAVAEKLVAMSDVDFTAALQEAFGYRLGRLTGVGVRHQFPLRMVQAKENVRPGVLLLGNAAHALHPIAAQGFNLALFEVAVLAEKLAQGVHLDLAAVNADMEQQVAASVTVSHHLAQLFQQSSFVIKHLLPLGMIGMDKCTPLRRVFLANMMGRAGMRPPLLVSAGEE